MIDSKELYRQEVPIKILGVLFQTGNKLKLILSSFAADAWTKFDKIVNSS